MSTPMLDAIAAHGNRDPLPEPGQRPVLREKQPNWITCADGFKLSVIAGPGTYCTPRPALLDLGRIPDPIGMYEVASDYPGPYHEVEVGYPSQRPEPWHCTAWNDGYDRRNDHEVCDGWQVFADSGDDPETGWDTVYGYVPVDMVCTLIESHGGEA